MLTNVLSPDGITIGVMYMRMNPEGKTTNVTFATYEKDALVNCVGIWDSGIS